MQRTSFWICLMMSLTLAAEELTYVDLVGRLTDLSQLAVLPDPGEKNAQWSSYDRASKYDEGTQKYVGWDANGDGGGIIRKEGNLLVLAEMQGPGCIWRIWSADPQQGRVKIFLDGASEPAIDLPFRGYFDRKNPPFDHPALVHTVARGWNNYIPIPYAKSCKIVAEPGWGQYYQFVYQTFAPGTRVPTFKRELGLEEIRALREANDVLLSGGVAPKTYAGEQTLKGEMVIAPGKSATLAALGGSQAITGLRFKVELPAGPADRDALREMTVQMHWDDEEEPSVWAPFGDFFGTTTSHTYRSLPLGRGGDEWWYCNWYMPFKNKGVVRLGNDGAQPRTVKYEITHAPLPNDEAADALGRFHAKWHRDAFAPPEAERQKIDWTLLTTQGRGRFAGVMLHIWNPRGSWWGEGDEKFHIDGEKFPSTFGTGSEDYFGYAWCDPGLFENAYHNQTQNDGNNKGHITVNRWHIADNVPFQTSFDGYIEKYYSNSRPTLYAATAYWYLGAGGRDPYKPVPVSERKGYWVPVQPIKKPGVVEGESLKVLSHTAGNPHEQDLSGFGDRWSNDAQMWWIGAKPGDKLRLAVPVQTAGRYKLLVQLTKAPDYGIVRLAFDGKSLGGDVDLFHQSVIPTGELDFGVHELTAGDHELAVEILGANENAVKNYMFGLDYIKLTPAQ